MGAPATKMVSKMLSKRGPRLPKTESLKISCLRLKFLTPGTLKIIKSVEPSSISSFSAYSRPDDKYHLPGFLFGAFSDPVGIKTVPKTCYQIVGDFNPSKYAPSVQKLIPSGCQMASQIHNKLTLASPWVPWVPKGCRKIKIAGK